MLCTRTEQILANETNITNYVCGTYSVKELTSKIYNNSKRLVEEIEANGGAMNCVCFVIKNARFTRLWNQLKSVEDGTTSVIGGQFSADTSTLMGQIQDQANESTKSKQIIQNREKSKVDKWFLKLKSSN